MNTIPVFDRLVCGVLRTYPANPDHALALHELTGGRTLEPRHVHALKQLGFTLQQVPDPRSGPNYGSTSVDSLSLPSTLNQ